MDKYLQTTEQAKRRLSSNTASEALSENVVKRRKGFSNVWKYFQRSDDKKLAKCLSCKREYKTSGNTSNLQDHLKRFHPNLDVTDSVTIVDHCTEALNPTNTTASTSSSCISSMKSVASYFNKGIQYEQNSKRKKDIDKALAMMIAIDVQPFNVVEDVGFIHFTEMLDPRYKIPSRTQVRDVVMKEIFEESVAKLKAILENISDIAVTCDCWTSSANENYLTVTCHFIHNYAIQTASLATTKLNDLTNHSAQNIADTLKEVLNNWNVFEKTVCIVTDNASTMLKACQILKIRNLPCFAHSINLVVQDGLKIESDNSSFKTIFTKCKTIVRFFKQSTIANEKLKIAQDCESPYSLIQETPTRWNSFFLMIERILKTNDAISKVLLATTNAPLPFTAIEINILKDVEKILAYFQNATAKISGGKYVTVSLIIPMAYGLYRKLEYLSQDLNTLEGKMLQQKLLESIKTRLFSYEQRTVTRMSTIVDPRFKKDGFQHSLNAEQASIYFENELANLSHKNSAPNFDVKLINQSKDATFFDFIQEKALEKRPTARSDAIIIMRQYLERPIASQETDPLLWMKVNENDFSLIKRLMLKYLCVPATSVESERMFSKAGQIVSDRRTRLKDKNVNMLLFLNKNVWLINENKNNKTSE